MADHFYSVNKGHGLDPSVVTAGTSTSGQSIELRVHDGDGLIRLDVLKAIEVLKQYMNESAQITP